MKGFVLWQRGGLNRRRRKRRRGDGREDRGGEKTVEKGRAQRWERGTKGRRAEGRD